VLDGVTPQWNSTHRKVRDERGTWLHRMILKELRELSALRG